MLSIITQNTSVAQGTRAWGFYPQCRGFKSCQAYQTTIPYAKGVKMFQEDFESFEKFRKPSKTKNPLSQKKESDHKIREARRSKERVKQAILLEDAESIE